eukprot:gene32444-31057_t
MKGQALGLVERVAEDGSKQLGLLLSTAHTVGALDTAKGAAEALVELLPASSPTAKGASSEVFSSAGFWMLHQVAQRRCGEFQESEAKAEAFVGLAQVAFRSEDWDQAEELLGDALAAAEADGGWPLMRACYSPGVGQLLKVSDGTQAGKKDHPRVAIILSLLGHVYSRSARVTFAEGLFREATKMLRIDPLSVTAAQQAADARGVVHSSVLAVVGWRYHQLLSALPKRGA